MGDPVGTAWKVPTLLLWRQLPNTNLRRRSYSSDDQPSSDQPKALQYVSKFIFIVYINYSDDFI